MLAENTKRFSSDKELMDIFTMQCQSEKVYVWFMQCPLQSGQNKPELA